MITYIKKITRNNPEHYQFKYTWKHDWYSLQDRHRLAKILRHCWNLEFDVLQLLEQTVF